jgi:hypothetical protein
MSPVLRLAREHPKSVAFGIVACKTHALLSNVRGRTTTRLDMSSMKRYLSIQFLLYASLHITRDYKSMLHISLDMRNTKRCLSILSLLYASLKYAT